MLEINPIKAFNDNYLWLFKEADSASACIVDPGDAKPVLAYLKKYNLSLEAILITHHHADHIGGVEELLEQYDVPVYGPESSHIPSITRQVHDSDSFIVANTSFKVIEIPGHTLDHIAYYTDSGAYQPDLNTELPALFCGDTLFAGGCGRIFEGTAPMMFESLQKLAQLKPGTEVFCAHEYTLNNLSFAQAVAPNDEAINKRFIIESEKRKKNLPTVPTSIEIELKTNPYLRCSEKIIRQNLNLPSLSPVNVFAALRQWKDNF